MTLNFVTLDEDATPDQMREAVRNLRAQQVKCGRDHLRYGLLADDIDLLVDLILVAELEWRGLDDADA